MTLASGLTIRCLGRFEVWRDGVPVHDWRRDKARTLLKHLVSHRGSISRDVLLDLLWPELEQDAAARNLRVTLHALRRALANDQSAQPYILSRGDSYRLNPEAPLWIDVEAFSERFEAATRLERQGRLDEALSGYEAAESLYRDDYLVDDLYAEWTMIPRERLKDQYLQVLTRLADAAFAAGDYERCITCCHKILSRDSCREQSYQQLMRCHSLLGHRARAFRWFDVCRDVLARELGEAPAPSTFDLLRRITPRASDEQPEATRLYLVGAS